MKLSRTRSLIVFVLTLATAAMVTVSPVAAGGNHKSEKRVSIPKVAGSVYTLSDQDFKLTFGRIEQAIEANPNLTIVSIVDHADAAAQAGLELEPNRVIFFGNPNLGTPLMQANQLTGIDLPQKIQVFEENGNVFVGFNDSTLLAKRHDLRGQPGLETIAGALRTLVAVGTGDDAPSRSRSAWRFARNNRITTVVSDADIDTTYDRLLAAIDGSPANVAFQVDHQANAESVGLELNPTRLVVFGNPNIGTPLMQADPTAGIDLPLKILVWEDDNGQVFVSTNEIRFLRQRHGLNRVDLSGIDTALGNFLAAAAGPTQ